MSLISKHQYPVNMMDRLFNGMFDESFFPTISGAKTFGQPRVNIKENDTRFELELAAPGLYKEDFAVDVQDNNLTVKAERKVEEEVKADNYMRKEFGYTSFQRNFQLPENVKVEAIEAKYENGVLSVILPKQEAGVDKAPKSIDIH
ncbi:MAG: Hsp20/alpha crystallin family protein [Bacteroidota bacterium]